MINNIWNKTSRNLKYRIAFGLAYSIISGLLLYLFRNEMFDINVSINSWHVYYRLIWCLSLSFLGFGFLILFWIVPRVLRNAELDEILFLLIRHIFLQCLLRNLSLFLLG